MVSANATTSTQSIAGTSASAGAAEADRTDGGPALPQPFLGRLSLRLPGLPPPPLLAAGGADGPSREAGAGGGETELFGGDSATLRPPLLGDLFEVCGADASAGIGPTSGPPFAREAWQRRSLLRYPWPSLPAALGGLSSSGARYPIASHVARRPLAPSASRPQPCSGCSAQVCVSRALIALGVCLSHVLTALGCTKARERRSACPAGHARRPGLGLLTSASCHTHELLSCI